MGLFKKNKPTITNIEVSDKNVKVRAVLVILLLALGLGLLSYGIYALVTKEPGWYTIELTEGYTDLNNELIFNYRIGDGEVSAADEHKAVSTLYAAEVSRVYRLLDIYQGYEDVVNLYTLNQYPGETFEVDPVLYEAFSLMEETGSRIPYMAPVFSMYRNLFSSQTDAEAGLIDPHTDEETREYLGQVMAYAADPAMIRVELLENHAVSLYISDEYRAFLREHEITDYIDFGWLTNALIVDHVADVMISRGFTAGNITSYDGYTRNFDFSGEYYGFNIFDRKGSNVYPAAVAQYRGQISMVFLRDYPLSMQDMTVYYAYEDGRYVHRYANPATGIYESSLRNLVSYSYDAGCAEVAIRMADVFISEAFNEGKVEEMSKDRVYTIWCLDETVCYNDEALILRDFYEDETLSYEGGYRPHGGQ